MEPVINHQLISTLMIEKTWFHHIPPSESIPVMMLHSISHTKDRTTEVALDCGAQVLSSSRGRAVQMNTGARATKAGFWVKVKQKGMIGYAFWKRVGWVRCQNVKAPVLLFLHADTDLPEGAVAAISGLRLKWILHRFPIFSHADARTSLRDLISADSPQGHSCWPQVPDTIAAWHLQVALCDPNVMGGLLRVEISRGGWQLDPFNYGVPWLPTVNASSFTYTVTGVHNI